MADQANDGWSKRIGYRALKEVWELSCNARTVPCLGVLSIIVLIVRCFREASPIGRWWPNDSTWRLLARSKYITEHEWSVFHPTPPYSNEECCEDDQFNSIPVLPVPKLQSANFKQGCRSNVDGCLFFVSWEVCRCHSSYLFFYGISAGSPNALKHNRWTDHGPKSIPRLGASPTSTRNPWKSQPKMASNWTSLKRSKACPWATLGWSQGVILIVVRRQLQSFQHQIAIYRKLIKAIEVYNSCRQEFPSWAYFMSGVVVAVHRNSWCVLWIVVDQWPGIGTSKRFSAQKRA